MADRSLREALTEARTAINETIAFFATETPDAVGTLQELSRVRDVVDAALALPEPAGLEVTDAAVEAAMRTYWVQMPKGINVRALLEAAVPFLQGSANQHQDLATDREALHRKLTIDEMSYRGYSDGEIAMAETNHHTDACELDGGMGWDCTDEDGKPNHPITDEMADIAGVIGRVLDRLDGGVS